MTASSSMLISLFLCFSTLSTILILRDVLVDSDKGKILGGFLSSLVFLFGIIAFGNFQGSFNKETGWFEVVSTLLFAEFIAISVHFVCFSSCIVYIYEMNQISAETPVTEMFKKTKK